MPAKDFFPFKLWTLEPLKLFIDLFHVLVTLECYYDRICTILIFPFISLHFSPQTTYFSLVITHISRVALVLQNSQEKRNVIDATTTLLRFRTRPL